MANSIRVLIDLTSKHDAGGQTLNFEARVVEVDEHNKLRNPSFQRWERGNGDYADLGVRAHASKDFTPTQFLFSGCEFIDLYSLDAQRAEVIVKTFRKIQRKLDAYVAKFGDAQDLVTYMTRFADAIGAIGFVWRSGPKVNWDYDSTEYRFGDANTFRFHIENELRQWQKKVGITEESAC